MNPQVEGALPMSELDRPWDSNALLFPIKKIQNGGSLSRSSDQLVKARSGQDPRLSPRLLRGMEDSSGHRAWTREIDLVAEGDCHSLEAIDETSADGGTMDANPRRRLSPANPFRLNYHVLRTCYGVSILQTPTLLTFSQLQNFLLRLALAHHWRFYFWSHMDVVVVSNESAIRVVLPARAPGPRGTPRRQPRRYHRS